MIDPAVALGITREERQWPPIKRYGELVNETIPEPDVLIEGVLHQGGKLLLGGGSKAYKSWSLIDLAVSLQAGVPWWNQKCAKAKVLFINFEIQEWSFRKRLADVIAAKGLEGKVDDFDVWTLRGYAADLTLIRPIIEQHIEGRGYQAVILDPNYMLMGDRDENSAGQMGALMNEFECLATKHNLSVILSHHFSKGNKSQSESIDRFSGSGVFARNPDSLVVLTAHEEDERSFTCEMTLRNFPPVDPFVIQWKYPRFEVNYNLNPDNLKKNNGPKKLVGDDRLLREMGSRGFTACDLFRFVAEKFQVSDSTAKRNVKRLLQAGKLLKENGLYLANQTTF